MEANVFYRMTRALTERVSDIGETVLSGGLTHEEYIACCAKIAALTEAIVLIKDVEKKILDGEG